MGAVPGDWLGEGLRLEELSCYSRTQSREASREGWPTDEPLHAPASACGPVGVCAYSGSYAHILRTNSEVKTAEGP